jgi:hypothetical protein
MDCIISQKTHENAGWVTPSIGVGAVGYLPFFRCQGHAKEPKIPVSVQDAFQRPEIKRIARQARRRNV